MPVAVALREDFAAPALREAARASRDAGQVRRLLALAAIYDGASRSEAAAIGGVTLQIVRDWVLRFNADGPAGLIARKAPGQKPKLSAAPRKTLAQMVERGPIASVHGVVRWRIIDLCQACHDQFRVTVSKQTMSRELRALGYRKLSARPRHHAQRARAIEAFKKNSTRLWRLSRASGACASATHRGLVRRRGQGRPEEQDHPPLGPARQPAGGGERPAHRLDLHLRRHLPRRGQGLRTGPATLQHSRHEPALGRDLGRRYPRPPCRPVA